MNSVTHIANGVTYTIRYGQIDMTWHVQAFSQQEAKIGPCYDITFETATDMEKYGLGQNGLDVLIDIVKGDLDSGRIK